MVRRTSILLLAAAVWLTAACAPSVIGGRGNPVDLARQSSVTATPGSAVYARIAYPAGSFGFQPGALRDRMAVPVGIDASGVRITSLFELVDVVAPEGWRWRVHDVWAVSRGGRAPSFEVTLRLDVPADARLGGQPLRGTLLSRTTGGRERVSLVVQLVPRR